MGDPAPTERGSDVLGNKRVATQYRILVEIAERQPAVSQQEVADAIGITSQAVSNYLQRLIEDGYVEKQGRGRYEVTKEGVDWLISRTDDLRALVQHVSEDVVGHVDVESALAIDSIAEGDRVVLSMQDGCLHAAADDVGDATAVAVTDTKEGRDVGVTDFEGVLDYELGTVTIVSVPTIRHGGSSRVDAEVVVEHAENNDLLAVAGVEAVAAVREAGLSPDVRFGTADAVREAATKGLDVFLLAVTDQLSAHTDRLRDGNITYEVLDATTE